MVEKSTKSKAFKVIKVIGVIIGIIGILIIGLYFYIHHFTTYANRYIDAKAAVSVPL